MSRPASADRFPMSPLRRLVATTALLLPLIGFAASDSGTTDKTSADADYTPSRGQPGKDVVWIATPDQETIRMLQLAQTTPADLVVDLGSGDGKIVIAAARDFGARAFGIEFNPDMVALAQRNAERAGVADKARFQRGDFFEADFRDATVVTLYLLPQLNLRLRSTLLAMKPGTRVVSHQWTMGDWPADEATWIRAIPIRLWIVPANAGGSWRLSYPVGDRAASAEMTLTQVFQRLTETWVEFDGLRNTLRQPQIDGDRIRFGFTDIAGVARAFDGRIDGDSIRGTVTGPAGVSAPFSAQRMGTAPPIGGSQGYSEEESIRVGEELGAS